MLPPWEIQRAMVCIKRRWQAACNAWWLDRDPVPYSVWWCEYLELLDSFLTPEVADIVASRRVAPWIRLPCRDEEPVSFDRDIWSEVSSESDFERWLASAEELWIRLYGGNELLEEG